MDIGRCDVCIPVDSFSKMQSFYRKLGLHKVEGEAEKKWEILEYLNLRLGLFEGHFKSSFMLNFRGGKNNQLLLHFQDLGFEINDQKAIKEDGTGSFTIIDPDGYLIFFDSTAGEIKQRSSEIENGIPDYKSFHNYQTEILLGLVHTCFEVSNLEESLQFYEKLGLKLIEGSIDEEYVIMTYDNLVLGLFQGSPQKLTLNFRGGNIREITNELAEKGFEFVKKFVEEEDNSYGSMMLDPEDNLIYFNTYTDERDLLKYLEN